MVMSQVYHRVWKTGKVLQSRCSGFELFVLFFSDGKRRWVRRCDLVELVDDFEVGDWVEHGTMGVGKVLELVPGTKGYKVKVEFDDPAVGIKKFLQAMANLRKVERGRSQGAPEDSGARSSAHGADPPPKNRGPIGPVREVPSPGFRARSMLEALRLGIVPYESVDRFTFGREEEASQVSEWLDDPDDPTMVLLGEYGSGKTHLLNFIYTLALRSEYAVARVEIDPAQSPFFKPKRVYSRFVRTFKYPKQSNSRFGGFREFLRAAFQGNLLKDHAYFKHLTGNPDEIVWDWIEGGEAILRPEVWSSKPFGNPVNRYGDLPGMYDFTTTANLYCYLLSALGHAARKLGLKGVLLLFDEAEAVDMSFYAYQGERSRNFLRALVRTADNGEELLGEPCRTGLEYSKMSICENLPFLYRDPCGLKLLFAFTNSEVFDFVTELCEVPSIELESLGDQALRDILNKVSDLYRAAYEFRGSDLEAKVILDSLTRRGERTRFFVKGAVEAFDIARLRDGMPLSELLS